MNISQHCFMPLNRVIPKKQYITPAQLITTNGWCTELSYFPYSANIVCCFVGCVLDSWPSDSNTKFITNQSCPGSALGRFTLLDYTQPQDSFGRFSTYNGNIATVPVNYQVVRLFYHMPVEVSSKSRGSSYRFVNDDINEEEESR